MIAESFPRALEGIVGGDFSDPTNERIIYLSALGLAIVGLVLLVGTILWWRRSRQEHPALAPLEVMSRRAWYKAPEGDRRRRLDHVRLAGSEAGEVEVVRSEPVDLQALVRSTPLAFDDLREPREAPVAAEVEGVDAEQVERVVESDEPVVESDEPVSGPDVAADEPSEEVVVAEAANEASDVVAADATSVGIERPATAVEPSVDTPDLATATPEAPVEVLATGSNDSLT